ncbi:P22 coat protein - protein 5 domain protein [Desemzia sp. FAM 23989]|uniref:P22 coat protein - protein 5 domain protein n=1 Tax=Desemzia sp. FAM 23989 TaxID=3259523 RepID=UPI003887C65A
MTVKNFIPTIWSTRLMANLDKDLVFLNMVNRDYEGEISAFGDTVKINQMGDVTIKEYTGADIADPEDLNSEQQTLTIDQAHYFNFRVKDVDKAQANVTLMDKGMARASYASADKIDMDIAKLITSADVTQKVGTVAAPIEITALNAYDYLVDLGTQLTTYNVSKVDRKIVLPPWYFGLLSKDARFTKDLNILRNGVVENSTVGGFQLLESNNVHQDTTGADAVFQVMAGTTQGISFANQVLETEAYRPEKNFADAVKGLVTYGRKIVEPKALVQFNIKQAPKV